MKIKMTEEDNKPVLNVDTIIELSNSYARFEEAKEQLYKTFFNVISHTNYFQEHPIKPLIDQLTINNFFINMTRYMYHKIIITEQKERLLWDALIKSTSRISII